MLNKNKNVCLIDDFEIISKNNRGIWLLSNHLKKHHNIKLEDYIKKYYHNNKIPFCKCGCGNDVKFHKGKYNEYYSNHIKNIKRDSNTLINAAKIRNSIERRLERLKITIEEIKFYYIQYIEFKISLSDIEKKYGFDKRTLKKYWIELGYITNLEEFNRISKKHKYFWSNKNPDIRKKMVEPDLLLNIYLYLKENRYKYTLNEICNKFELKVNSIILKKRLSEEFGDNIIDELLKSGLSSKPEMEYYNILKYYFGEKIKKGFKLKNKYYDYILNDKILIEFDGDYWHSKLSNKINDKLKDKIAINENYIIYRIKESESKDINHLIKLFKLHNK